MVQVGDVVPDIEVSALVDNETKKVKLSDYHGKWVVLIFYPEDFSYICPTELKEASARYSEFQKLWAEVLSVSTNTVYSHQSWRAQDPEIGKIPYPMLADPEGKFCKAFNSYISKEGVSLRSTFIVDPDGVIQALEVNSNSIGRNIDETLRKLKAAIYVRDHPGALCPASWEPGMRTLKADKGAANKPKMS
jgi:peroxiredoxin (alkyl hydroperoxide reductase subunit C)